MKQMSDEMFIAVVNEAFADVAHERKSLTEDEIVEALIRANFFSPEFIDGAAAQALADGINGQGEPLDETDRAAS